LKNKVQFHETRLPVSRRIVQIALTFLPARSVLLQPAFAAANRYDSRWPYGQNITINTSEINGTSDTLTDFPVLINSNDTNLTSGQVQSQGNDILLNSLDGTTDLPYKRENFTQSTGNLLAWVNVSDLFSTTCTIISKYCGNSLVSTRQHTEEVFSRGDLLSEGCDLSGVVDAGTAIRKELA
jgi:hypothetical protein